MREARHVVVVVDDRGRVGAQRLELDPGRRPDDPSHVVDEEFVVFGYCFRKPTQRRLVVNSRQVCVADDVAEGRSDRQLFLERVAQLEDV